MAVKKKPGRVTLESGSMGTQEVKVMKMKHHRSLPGAGAEWASYSFGCGQKLCLQSSYVWCSTFGSELHSECTGTCGA